MDARGIGGAILRGALATVRHVVFFVMLFCRPFVKFVVRAYMFMVAAFFVIAYFLKPDLPMATYWVNGVAFFVAALLSWKYDTLLMWLTPDGRRLYLDV